MKTQLIAAAIAAVLITAACATAPVEPDGAAKARAMLTRNACRRIRTWPAARPYR